MNTKEKTALVDVVRTRLTRNTTFTETKNVLRVPKGQPNAGCTIGTEVVFAASGDGVSTPFRRNYLKKALAKLSVEGANVTVRKTARKSGVTEIAVTFLSAAAEAAPALEAAEPVEVEAAAEAEAEAPAAEAEAESVAA